MATETRSLPSAHAAPAQKFSRYRSTRQGASKPQPPPPSATQGPAASQNESVVQSMSRYRRPASKTEQVSSPPAPRHTPVSPKSPQSHSVTLAALTGEPFNQDLVGVPEQPPPKAAASRPRHDTDAKNVPSLTSHPSSPTPQKPQPPQTPRHAPPVEETPRPRQVSWGAVCAARAQAQSPHSHAHQEARDIMAAENERILRLQAHQAAEREAKLEKRRIVAAEEQSRQERVQAEQHQRDKARLEGQQPASRKVVPAQEGRQPSAQERSVANVGTAKKGSFDLRRGNSIREKFSAFTRTKPVEVAGSDKVETINEKLNLTASRRPRGTITKSGRSSDAPTGTSAHSREGPAGWVDAPVSKSAADEPAETTPGQWIDAPVSRTYPPDAGPVVVPQHDAPVSAVNAGERRVHVQCRGSSITLPVTPSTTPRDLINSASVVMSESIDPAHSTLVESFTQLGLERSLRRYEHVRDVMNSWDNDAQNTFIILPSGEDFQQQGLDSKNAPKQQPGGTSVSMYHSQRPGTWDKRWITLKSDGQVTVAKRQGQESANVCHITDYDIYIPTLRQQTKRIKPPKKICFAVKSQQKSNMFLDGANFVHFFASNDKTVAHEWYQAVQGWRSWYLVNILGEGQKPKREPSTTSPARPTASRSRRASIDSTPYQLGSFQPLSLDLGEPNYDNSSAPRATKSAELFHARKISSRDRVPPSSFLNKLSKDADSGVPTSNQKSPSIVKGTPPDEIESSTFAPTSLLGRTYSQRQKAQREREINGGRSETMRSTEPPGASLSRRGSIKSVRAMPKPLVDLTPQYQEPPQHVRKGRGVAPEPGQRLVDVATGLDLPPGAIVTPSAKAWRRPQANSPPQESLHRTRGTSIDAEKSRISLDGVRPKLVTTNGRPEINDNDAFIEGGLLARTASKRTQGAGATGRGVRTGDRNAVGKPMIDLQLKSKFVGGSLLRQVEAHSGGDGPVIDREKRREESVRVGEGM